MPPLDYLARLEQATRGLFELHVTALDHMHKRIGVAPLRALQMLEHRGPCRVTELGDAMELLPSTASRLSDRLAQSGLITRRMSSTNRRATILELTDSGRAVLEELVALRTEALAEIADGMSEQELAVFLQGASAFRQAQLQIGQAHG